MRLATAVSALLGDLTSFALSSSPLVLGVTLDFVQDHRAGRGVLALARSVAVNANGILGGKPVTVPVALTCSGISRP